MSQSDLEKDGTVWNRLTPDLKDQLVAMGKQKLGVARPDGATYIEAVEPAKLVAEIDKQYTNVANQSKTIYSVYAGANDTLAGNQFNQLAPSLQNGP